MTLGMLEELSIVTESAFRNSHVVSTKAKSFRNIGAYRSEENGFEQRCKDVSYYWSPYRADASHRWLLLALETCAMKDLKNAPMVAATNAALRCAERNAHGKNTAKLAIGLR